MIYKELLQQSLDALHDARDYLDIVNTQAAQAKAKRVTKVMESICARLAEECDTTYEVWQNDEWQAGSNLLEETMRYAHRHAEDGAVAVHEVTRRVICEIEK